MGFILTAESDHEKNIKARKWRTARYFAATLRRASSRLLRYRLSPRQLPLQARCDGKTGLRKKSFRHAALLTAGGKCDIRAHVSE